MEHARRRCGRSCLGPGFESPRLHQSLNRIADTVVSAILFFTSIHSRRELARYLFRAKSAFDTHANRLCLDVIERTSPRHPELDVETAPLIAAGGERTTADVVAEVFQTTA